MRRAHIRNPSQIAGWLIEDNGAEQTWAAWFELPAEQVLETARTAFERAGALRVTPLAWSWVLVEFAPTAVRRIAAAAAALRAILIGNRCAPSAAD